MSKGEILLFKKLHNVVDNAILLFILVNDAVALHIRRHREIHYLEIGLLQARRKQLNMGGGGGGSTIDVTPPPPQSRSQKHYLGVNIGGAEDPLAPPPLFRRPCT